ncbi:hypothetical protein SAICODRAFT_59826 [Saitoella complicata NRRL Y-17804]|uniref:uncharacterized protein n=1 Tax=Saitoella complicata (strain BCRC 22490 / CBS 7301 / JCM 7358 / NBRC 10748 / NRRL Y-17804) TaxID=698492 RepID=UPI000866C2A6|nr:uncharacterized protein SAICODRAFT_59826 [Saitoella complicata NRRL Y-17804]ODQ51605.1 hypothetical protein SAICODRAFT_59826 [Saitoella complicata NRRL Y-17804]
MDGDQYGLKGLLGVIRMENQDLSMLALGNDLTSLGLNMNQSDDRPLYASFNSPWMETNNKDVEPVYHLPACYNVQPPPPAHTKIQSFSDETLFYIFYSMPRDVMQEYAAAELTARNWRYHKELRMWLTKDPNAEPNLKTTAYERGEYVFFDHLHWEKIRKEFVLVYEALENRPFSINGATPSMGSPSAVQAQLAGTPAPGHAAPSLPNGF